MEHSTRNDNTNNQREFHNLNMTDKHFHRNGRPRNIDRTVLQTLSLVVPLLARKKELRV